ncbi:MAG TPA: cysteine dioxygenase [Burkholderiales bacterium]|nr:cysteine dioxygenase [Burkholderiales bacterium]
MKNIRRLRELVIGMTGLVQRHRRDEMLLLRDGGELLAQLIAHDDWLPDTFAAPHRAHHQEYLLHCDPLGRFSILSLVLAPGQKTPVHDHTVWCLIGILRGTERIDEYRHEGEGAPMQKTGEHLCRAGDIDVVSPTVGDIHVMANPLRDQPAVSIHIFGADIGGLMRRTFSLATGEPHALVSGYANSMLPNLWDRSLEAHA